MTVAYHERLRKCGPIGLAVGLSILSLQGCAALLLGDPQVRGVDKPGERWRTTQILAGSVHRAVEPEPAWPVTHLRVRQRQRCLVETHERHRHYLQHRRVVPASGWWLVLAEAGLGAAGLWLGSQQEDLAQDGLRVAGAGATVAAVADTLVLTGILGRGESLQGVEDRVLGGEETICQDRPAPWVQVQVDGEVGRVDLAADATGLASLELTSLPAQAFPYRSPVAKLSCEGCTPVPLRLPPDAAAHLVLTRRGLDDLEAWLAVHGRGHAQSEAVRQALAAELSRLAGQQAALLQRAQAALARGDLLQAEAEARACVEIRRLAAPACEAVRQQVDERFLDGEVRQVQAALSAGDLEAAEAALYRCTIVRSDHPPCLRLQSTLRAHRREAFRAKALAALRQGQFVSARQELAGCLALEAADEACLEAGRKIDAAERAVAVQKARKLQQQAQRAWQRGQRDEARRKAAACLELDPDNAKCRSLLK